jgi:uncharacterized protein (TIGR02118 family)
MTSLIVLYPQTADSRFDLDYYLNVHTPLVKERLTSGGLISVDLRQGMAGAAPDSPPAYAMVCHLNFETIDQLQAALATHGPELIGDIPNFTNVQPIMQIGMSV